MARSAENSADPKAEAAAAKLGKELAKAKGKDSVVKLLKAAGRLLTCCLPPMAYDGNEAPGCPPQQVVYNKMAA